MQKVLEAQYAIEYIPEKGIKVYAKQPGTDSYVEIRPDYFLRERLRREITFL